MAKPIGPPPKKPTAILTLVSSVDGVVVLLTTGTGAPPGRTLVSGQIVWEGGPTQTWTGDPPATVAHTYTTPGIYTRTATLTVVDNKNGRARKPLGVDVAVAQPSVAPTCLSLSTANENPSTLDDVRWTVLFSSPVTGVTLGAFSLVNSGLAGPSLTSVVGSGTTYTVEANRGSGIGTLGLNLTTGTGIVGTNLLPLTGVPVTGDVYAMIAPPPPDPPTPPTCLGILRTDISPTLETSVHWSVTFSVPVTGVTLSAFALANVGLTGPSLTSVTGSGADYVVTAGRGTGDGTLGLNLTTATGIISAEGATLTGTPITGEVYTIPVPPIDPPPIIAPTCTSIVRANPSPTSATSVSWTVTFSVPVTGVVLARFALVNSGLTGAALIGIAGLDTTWTVTASRGTAGNGTLGLNLTSGTGIVDGNGTALTAVPVVGQVYTFISPPVIPPTCLSITRLDPSPTTAATFRWQVTFSVAVTGVTTGAFSLINGGLTAPSITGITGSGASYIVTANRGSGDGTLGLNLTDGTGIQDGASTPLGGVPVIGQVYTVETPPDPPIVAPTCLSIVRAAASPTNASSVAWTVTFSVPVAGVALTNFSLVNTGLSSPTLIGLTGTSATYTVTAARGSGDGTLGLNLTSGTGIVDGNGTPLVAVPVVGQVYTFTTPPPIPSDVLQQSDFTYLGYYDIGLEGLNSPYSQGITHRYVSGDLRLLYWAYTDGSLELTEVSLAGIPFGGQITASSNHWATPYGDPYGMNGQFFGLWWDEPLQRLWSMNAVDYTPVNIPVQIRTRTLNANGTISNLRGPIGIQNVQDRHVFGGAQAVPSWFQTQYGVGPYVVGWGGYLSLLSNGPVSMGLRMHGIPNPTTYPDNGEIPVGSYQTLANHSSGSVGTDWYLQSGALVPSTFDRGARLAGYHVNYLDANSGGPPNDLNYTPPTMPPDPGWWSGTDAAPNDGYSRMSWTDSYFGGGAWIDGTTKSGFVTLATLADGLVWYQQATIQNSEGRGYEFSVFDPETLGQVAQGTRAPFVVTPVAIWRPSLPGLTYATAGIGLTYDSTTQRLYVFGPGGTGLPGLNRIYVFAVNA